MTPDFSASALSVIDRWLLSGITTLGQGADFVAANLDGLSFPLTVAPGQTSAISPNGWAPSEMPF